MSSIVVDFIWCRDNSFETITSCDNCQLCYISTENNRVVLEVHKSVYSCVPYELLNSTWTPLGAHKVKIGSIDVESFESEKDLIDFLSTQLQKQFPHAIESYFESLPKASALKQQLFSYSTLGELSEIGYPIWHANVQKDKEWDGAVGIDCKGGVLLVPYVLTSKEDDIQSAEIIHEYSTFRYSNIFAAIFGTLVNVSDWFSEYKTRFNWSSFKSRVNEN